VQVSDRRLTMPDGTVVDERANKAICLWCQDAYVAIGYAGLACIGAKPTDEWLLDNLLLMRASLIPLQQVSQELRQRLTDAFKTLRHIVNRSLTVVFAGYFSNGEPFWGSISNEVPAGQNIWSLRDEVRVEFRHTVECLLPVNVPSTTESTRLQP
jgi:hypothetical protein